MAERTRSYAEGTKVPVERSKAEIEKTLARFGASGFGYMTHGDRSVVMFEARGRRVRFFVPAAKGSTERAREAESRRLWRSLALAIKSKLDVVQSGISTFEAEMLPYTLLADGRTFHEWAEEHTAALSAGNLPPMLPAAR